MHEQYDLVIIGTGSAATAAAYKCRSAGWRVAVVDYRPFGGTCALRGCDPKKVLIGAAELMDWIHNMQGRGAALEGARVDWPALMRFKRSFTGSMPQKVEEGFKGAGIDSFHGRARFTDGTALQLGDTTLKGRHVLIAAGARPAPLGIAGEALLTDSEHFLEMERLPRRLVFVGGGYVSFEFAHLAARAGAGCTILHRGERPLVGFDPELTAMVVEASRAAGIEIVLGASVDRVEGQPGNLTATAEGQGYRRSFPAEMVVHGAGRVAELEQMGLEQAGVRYGKRGVEVNDYLQSVSNPDVYAAGDAAASGGLPLTPVAGLEGGIAADNLLEGNRRRADYRGQPTVVFTIPPMASVGLQEEAAREQGLEFRVSQGDSSSWYTSRRVGQSHGGYKVLIGKEDDRILGAHLFGVHAEELINIFALAIRQGLRAGDLRETIYAYPTASYDITYML
jgi:glutathione reductase (NADPH)